ncbi:MAG: AraC family transcriptional regulator [Actinomycetaceae bacterium]|nr:AraC family transcriptional regulator [Actinomycetaceae bacterium]
MIDNAGHLMSGGSDVAVARAVGVDDNMVSSHSHHYFEIYYLRSGQRYHVIEDHLHLIKSGELIIFPPYLMHHSFGDKGVGFDRYVLYFSPEVVASAKLLNRIRNASNSYSFDGPEARRVEDIFGRLDGVQQRGDEFAAVEMRLLVNELLIGMARQEPSNTEVERRDRVAEVVRYLHDNHCQQLRLEDIAEEFYVSQYHLCREFKKFTKSTVMQYLNKIRIGQAQRLLDETDLNVTQISERVGFVNVTHFNRVFKQITGMAPLSYKKAHTLRYASRCGGEYSGAAFADTYNL